MREPLERAYYAVCLTVGRMLRAGTYSKVRLVDHNGVKLVKKWRVFYAPVLVLAGAPLMRLLNSGVRVLPDREWKVREQELYAILYKASIHIDSTNALVLPCLTGQTLAELLEDPALLQAHRERAIELAVLALTEFHARGFTHGDAMAENVLIDLAAGVACWFDFETVHDSNRSMVWCRADDVRALIASTLLRTPSEHFARTLQLVSNAYANKDVMREGQANFAEAFPRPLTFHLGQAALSFQSFRQIARLLSGQNGATT
jgi:hypothetical protein